MATIPAETLNPQQPVEKLVTPASPSLDVDFLRGFGSLPIVRQVGLMIALAASVALGVAVVLWMQQDDFRTLTGIDSPAKANEVVAVLDASGIPSRIDPRSGMLLVPADRLHEARMKMAGAGIADGSQSGFELLDKDQGFGVSQFMETARYRRSLEGELSRSVASINAVHQARVHLALPKPSAFLRDQRRPTASVTLVLAPLASMDGNQIRAIMNLVAGAVPELTPDNVVVVDQHGKLLSSSDEDPALERTERQLQHIQRVERQLHDKLAAMLQTLLGPDRFRVAVTADVDFTAVEQTQEAFDPEPRALRSERRLEESRSGELMVGGVPGALSNQPPGPAVAPEEGEVAVGEQPPVVPTRSRTEATRNFEIDRSISHTRHHVGRLARLTVSVAVDGTPPAAPVAQANPEDAAAEAPEAADEAQWTEEELAQLSTLVRTAVGYDEVRGDIVTVVASPFVQTTPVTVAPAPFWAEPWFLEICKLGLGALIVLLLIFLLLRPMFRNLSDAGEQLKSHELLAVQAAQQPLEGTLMPPMQAGQQLEAVRGIVSQSPETVARVVSQWTNASE